MRVSRASKEEINEFLKEFRKIMIQPGKFIFIKRKYDFTSLGLTLEQAKYEILTLKYIHYDRGPSSDHRGDGTEVWEFGKPIDGDTAYIKLKIEDDICKCISFKSSSGPFTLPYKNW
ncbi:type II toxin-antitoxin system MqsR family toxin [Lacicoccus qingdaonensis]|uniref:Motility quorum-sensing regulator, toxin of MqsA n=1 Tax=Lacicoccus qingdaonensis TaxID=576118 RepID=A0A1G9HNA8_9BACL|nr:type II toxin-antitoxin system MqsR family toxin [Salinicoccus qingdaonensis]SDL14372.1 Motility quorum-sensing regulator, toxin of MqsA [Salinicoccus qingdaonensis]